MAPHNIISGTQLYNWDTILMDDNYKHLADVALRLRPTPASEASAERMISRERMVIVLLRNRASNDLINARIALSGLRAQRAANNSEFADISV